MKTFITLAAVVALTAGATGAALAGTPQDRYNRSGTSSTGGTDPQRISNRDGYTPDANRVNDKFDPYTQGARSGTGSALVDEKSKAKKQKPQKKQMAKPMTEKQ
ncbi:hypothetical protein [Cupriavidus plantarum]|uniref:Uncharacterized protein n=1 Tax=Cupriavidus plantarum TaxID=942865 RepID=A0A316EX25_9BURK|nr:hypothetical protein [Cupriavidus plantarum]NYH99690.1 hypothetical protein [Cupriavidus plantarum]PWK36891.1 hypothetical protein C7419_101761 [Cupriavidus plantarum]REF02369.1 hypothetical protein C7418_1175 [Cupriavidus plantarum]RLK44775.1 hypothetical protein C7417_0768 [Cupriavidus plantarum]CAG2153047.1 hypothetical protein LMG26296_05232 [Cupriavidus plantarum]